MPAILLGGDLPGSAPNVFAGLQLWFDAATGVFTDTAGTTPAVDGNTVRSWRDRHNSYLVPDNGAGTGPLLDVDLANGYPALVFDATNDQLVGVTNDADAFQAAGVATMFSVVRHAASPTDQQIYMLFFGGGNFQQYLSNVAAAAQVKFQNHDGTDDLTVKAATLTNWNIATGMHSGGNIYCGVNDTRDASLSSAASGNTVIDANTNLHIRNVPAVVRQTEIAELIYFNVALTEAERKQIEIRLAYKYGITLPY